MSDLQNRPKSPDPVAPTGTGGIFATPASRERGLPPAVWVVAGLVVIAVLGVLLLIGRRHTGPASNTPLPPDPYAATLPISDLKMSESVSLSGGKSTFLDGHIRNTGAKTVSAATVQVFFRNEEGMPPAVESLPLSLIRTREPYTDTQPISAAPIRPGEDRDFRLIFEAIPGNWNTQLPEIRIVHVTTG